MVKHKDDDTIRLGSAAEDLFIEIFSEVFGLLLDQMQPYMA